MTGSSTSLMHFLLMRRIKQIFVAQLKIVFLLFLHWFFSIVSAAWIIKLLNSHKPSSDFTRNVFVFFCFFSPNLLRASSLSRLLNHALPAAPAMTSSLARSCEFSRSNLIKTCAASWASKYLRHPFYEVDSPFF